MSEDERLLKSFSLTDIGRKRKLNQDYVYSSDEPVGTLPNVYIVADGMGGHAAGDYASSFTVGAIVKEIEETEETDVRRVLGNAIKTANEELRRKAEEDTTLYGMGTTIVAATIIGNRLEVANVGDSRLYIIRDGIRQITRDHSLVQEMVRMGGMDPETARNHENKNIITRAIGGADTVDADFFKVDLKEGDIILMCTDGLTNMLDDDEIRMIVHAGRDVIEMAERLIRAANDHGGKDNIAVILIEPFA